MKPFSSKMNTASPGSRISAFSPPWVVQFSQLDEVITLWNQSDLSHTLSAKGYKKNSLFSLIQKQPVLEAEPEILFLLGHASI